MQSNPRPYHHGNLREALLSAAEAALEARGAAALSLRELSRAVGVSHASPRRHFSDKQGLLDALALTGFQRLDATLAQAAKGRARDLSVRIIRTAQAYVEFVLRHPALWALMFAAKHRAGAPQDLLAASDMAFSHLPAILRAGQEAGEIIGGDPARLSLTLNAALQGLVSISTEGKFKGVPLETLVPAIVKQVLLGLRPR